MKIRPEKYVDRASIRALLEDAFPSPLEANLVEKLRETEAYLPELALVAELESGEVAGFLLLTKASIAQENQNQEILVLAPLAVLTSKKHQGIGSKLVEAGITSARKAGFPGISVLGHAAFYSRFGFQKAKTYGIEAPFPVDEEHWMVLGFPGQNLEGLAGKLIYPQPFLEME
ncbi:GNAT family N-acetyltransferase [Listeria aquatica]|uniref:GNAT family N-acetyltransferase n=1 Tax=Listeria aquatica TaxID=1494960 RepID=UPI003EFA11F7